MMPNKFSDPYTTAKGEERAFVELEKLTTLWFNTGTLCNLSCENCYIESSPKNDRLSFLTLEDVTPYLDELKSDYQNVKMIGLTGGEPFLNPHIIKIISNILEYKHEVLILTNGFRAINKHKDKLMELKNKFHDKLHIRVSLDHHTKEVHEKERGHETFDKTLENIKWLFDQGVNLSIAGRSLMNEDQAQSKKMYDEMLKNFGVDLNLIDRDKLVIFPEMSETKEVPEITVGCWEILNKTPSMQMCASERMIVKRKGEERPTVLPCTLLAYDKQFDLGNRLMESKTRVQLNHQFCAQFCVLGGASCSSVS